jgi:hypothetical protein
MSFQAYLDAAEQKTGRTPQELVGTAGSYRDGSAVLRLDGVAARTHE